MLERSKKEIGVKFTDYLLRADYFAQSLNFSINRESKIFSCMGLTISLIIYIIFVILLYYFGRDFLLGINPNVILMENILEDPQNLDINLPENLFVALRLTDERNEYYTSFGVKVVDSYDNIMDVPLRQCKDQLNLIKLYNFTCIKINDMINESKNEILNTSKSVVQSFKILIKDKDPLAEWTKKKIAIEVFVPVVVFNPQNYNEPINVNYLPFKDIYQFMNIPYREIILSNYTLIDDKGYIFEKNIISNHFGVVQSTQKVYSQNGDTSLNQIFYSLSILPGEKNILISRSFQKAQEALIQSWAIMKFFLFIFSFIVYLPINFIKKTKLSSLVASVMEDKPLSRGVKYINTNEEEKIPAYQAELKNIAERISVLKTKQKNKKFNLRNKCSTFTDKPVEAENKTENGEKYKFTFLDKIEEIKQENESKKPRRSLNRSCDSEVSEENAGGNNGSSVLVNVAGMGMTNPKTKKLSLDQLRNQKRNSVDLLSLQIFNNNLTNAVNESNVIPLNHIENKVDKKKERMKGVLNLNRKYTDDNVNASQKSEFKSDTIMDIQVSKLSQKKRGKTFSFSYGEIVRKFCFISPLRNRDKIKWHLHNLLVEYIENRMDICSYFDLFNELRILKNALLTPAQNTALKNVIHPNLFITSIEGSDSNSKNIFYSKQNIDKLRDAFNFNTQEKNDAAINDMANYFTNKIAKENLTEADNILISNLNEECVTAIIKKLNQTMNELMRK